MSLGTTPSHYISTVASIIIVPDDGNQLSLHLYLQKEGECQLCNNAPTTVASIPFSEETEMVGAKEE